MQSRLCALVSLILVVSSGPLSALRAERARCAPQAPIQGGPATPGSRLSFEELPVGALSAATSKGWTLSADAGHAAVTDRFASTGKKALHVLGGAEHRVVAKLKTPTAPDAWLTLRAERWTRNSPFRFRIDALCGDVWTEVYDGDAEVAVGARFLTTVRCKLSHGTTAVRFAVLAPEPGGVLLDDLRIQNSSELPPPPVVRDGVRVRSAGQDGVHTYRIPGLVRTNAGSLIAVYDARWRGASDLPGDIDVGMSRSTDAGRTWSPMRIILDMGNDPKWHHEGVGDPAILVDRVTGTLFVVAVWSHGDRGWHGSRPGMTPDETGQIVLTRSDDDGLTWSPPVNITEQVKDPAWRFFLAGPGSGITTKDGTLVFAAQYRSADDSEFAGKPFSTLISSKDRGRTFTVGTGVRVDTTEAQVVELSNGTLMINCRDNRGGSRSVYTTADLGRTWVVHSSSRNALIEPVCMGSLHRIDHPKYGPLLLFSNPATTNGRHHLTVKISRDEGASWPERYHTLYDERPSYGYSCLAPIDEDHFGVLYEEQGSLRFVRFSIEELMEKR